MPVLYLILSITGWSALALFLMYWAIVSRYLPKGSEHAPSREFDVIQSPPLKHEKQP